MYQLLKAKTQEIIILILFANQSKLKLREKTKNNSQTI